MAVTAAPPAWRVIGRSVQGAQHERRGLANQDALLWWPEEGTGPPLLITLSDGHGSSRSFRSEIGARLACQTAAEVIRELLLVPRALFPLDLVRRGACERMPAELVRRWRAAVERHLIHFPFAAEEWDALESAAGRAARASLERNPFLAYGATLLAVAVDESFLLHVQLGDGDILSVSTAGQAQRPLPADARLFANETTSLCSETAAADMRVSLRMHEQGPPDLVLLSTDGYANSFRTDADFLKVGPDFLASLQSDGLQAVADRLEGWIAEASQQGSGDDITLGLVYRVPQSL